VSFRIGPLAGCVLGLDAGATIPGIEITKSGRGGFWFDAQPAAAQAVARELSGRSTAGGGWDLSPSERRACGRASAAIYKRLGLIGAVSLRADLDGPKWIRYPGGVSILDRSS